MGNLDRYSALLIQEITDFNARYDAAITSPIDGVVSELMQQSQSERLYTFEILTKLIAEDIISYVLPNNPR